MTKKIIIDNPDAEVTLEGLDFSGEAAIEVKAAKRVIIRNSRFYNIDSGRFLIHTTGTEPVKLTVSNNFFDENAGIYNLHELNAPLESGSSIEDNYFGETASTHNDIAIYAMKPKSVVGINRNTFGANDGIRIGTKGAATGTIAFNNNVVEKVLPDYDTTEFVTVQPYNKETETFAGLTVLLNGTVSPDANMVLLRGISYANDTPMTEERMPKVIVNGVVTEMPIDNQSPVEPTVKAVSIGDAQYGTLEDAIAAAKPGDVMVLNEDLVVGNNGKSGNTPIFIIPDGVTLDGRVHKIEADEQAWIDSGLTGGHILGVTAGSSEIRNIEIIGHARMKSGIVLSGPTVDANMVNLYVHDCANCGVQITNGAQVTIDNILTEENAWGAINVDRGSGGNTPSLLITNPDMQESVEAYTEILDEDVITAEGLTEVIGVGPKLKGFKYFTSDMARLGQAAVTVDGVTTVYENKTEAEEAAAAAGVDVVIL